jgi:hypothetical protein
MRISGFGAVGRVACLTAFGFVAAAVAGGNPGYDPALVLGDPSTGFSCGYPTASDGTGAPGNSTIDTYANRGFGVCVARMPGVTITKEMVSGLRAVVASKRVNGPIADSTRAMFQRAGYTQFGQTYFCRDTRYLLQPSQRFCFNLLPPQ